jgi:hypothetical protein
MRHTIGRYALGICLAVAGLFWNGEVVPNSQKGLVTTAQALIGAPATPLSYAGVARRSTVGVGAPGVGGPASGVGVLPGAGAGRAGVGVGGVGNYPGNRGGPVNRVGRR